MSNDKQNVLLIAICLLAFGMCPAQAKQAKAASGSKHDNHAPVEVTSDTLEVFQQQNKAVFTGHVVAIQQEVRLKSDVMTVHYRKQESKEKKPDTSPGGVDDSAITQIDANGHVFLSTPLETASGDKGVYDVQHHMIHLNENVVLTKGKNVLKGDHLVYNFDTQQSELTGGGAAAAIPSTAATGQGGHQRVRALFVPGGGDSKGKTDAK